MGRRINSTGLQATGGSVDGYFDKIIKYIPTDIVAAWTALTSLIGGQTIANTNAGGEPANNTLLWIVFVVMIVLTALWTWHQTRKPKLPPAKIQIIVATLSFVVWVFALGGPFKDYPFYKNLPQLGGVVLILWTLVLGIIPPDPDVPQNPPPSPPNP